MIVQNAKGSLYLGQSRHATGSEALASAFFFFKQRHTFSTLKEPRVTYPRSVVPTFSRLQSALSPAGILEANKE